MPLLIGSLVSQKMATLNELQTIYGLEDAYDMLEVLIVDSYNKSILNEVT